MLLVRVSTLLSDHESNSAIMLNYYVNDYNQRHYESAYYNNIIDLASWEESKVFIREYQFA